MATLIGVDGEYHYHVQMSMGTDGLKMEAAVQRIYSDCSFYAYSSR